MAIVGTSVDDIFSKKTLNSDENWGLVVKSKVNKSKKLCRQDKLNADEFEVL